MKSRSSVLCIALMVCVLSPAMSKSDETESTLATRELRLQLLDAETSLKLQELEVAVSKHAVEEAELEVGKARANLNSIQMRARSGKDVEKDQIEYSTLEVKQAQVRAEMKRLQSEMTRVQMELAKARFDHLRMNLNLKHEKEPVPVRFEIVNDSEAIVVRGSKEDVEKLKSLIERHAEN